MTQVLGAGDFFIGNTHVQTTSNTEFRGGTIDEIVVGAKLPHVKFHASVRLEGDASVISNTLTIAGLPGVTITVNSQTELKDRGNTIALNDLNGSHIKVRGRVTGSNTVIATRIQLRSPDKDVDLQGPVQSINGDAVVILGVSIDAGTINHFESVSGTSMSRAGFLTAVRVNSLVKVKGELSGTPVAWEEAELQD